MELICKLQPLDGDNGEILLAVLGAFGGLPAYRKLVLTKTYVAIYKLIGGTVYVYAIVNGTTDYPRLLK